MNAYIVFRAAWTTLTTLRWFLMFGMGCLLDSLWLLRPCQLKWYNIIYTNINITIYIFNTTQYSFLRLYQTLLVLFVLSLLPSSSALTSFPHPS